MSNINTNLYLGSRDEKFQSMIYGLLKRGKLKPKYIDILTTKKAMESWSNAFTASSADKINNYERFEQLGDVTANKFIIWYAYKRFPQLDCTDGVKVVARLRINYGSKQTFAALADSLGFWEYISAEEEGTAKAMKYRSRQKKDLLEDCFEAFIGCAEYLLDKAFRTGVGYGIVYDILANIFDELPMSLAYEDLYDPKTRLKQTFDTYPEQLGDWIFIDSRQDAVATAELYQAPPHTNQKPYKKFYGPGKKDFDMKPQKGWNLIGTGVASAKIDAQQKAAEQGIKTLRQRGWYKPPPSEYSYFCK